MKIYFKTIQRLFLVAGLFAQSDNEPINNTSTQDTTALMLTDTVMSTTEDSAMVDIVSESESESHLLVLYSGDLTEFTYEEIVEEVIIDAISIETKHRQVLMPMVVADTKGAIKQFSNSVEDFNPLLYSALESIGNVSITLPEDGDAVGCFTSSCILDMANKVDATHVLLWAVDQKRSVLKLSMNLTNVINETSVSTVKKVCLYKGNDENIESLFQRACMMIYEKPVPEDLAISKLNEFNYKIDFYLGRKNVLIGTGTVTAAGILAYLLQPETPAPGMGLPPMWPGK